MSQFVVGQLLCSDIPALKDDWKRSLLRRGRSPFTVRIYMWAVQTFVKQFGVSERPVDRDVLERWQDSLGDHLNARSGALARTGMHQLLIWAADRDLCDPRLERAIVGIKVDKRWPRPLHPNDVIRLQAHLIERTDPVLAEQMGERPPTLRDYRDRALFHYIIQTGGRVSEILQMKRATFERQIVRQKGGTNKELVAAPGVIGLIQVYLSHRTDRLDCLWIAVRTDGQVTPLHDDGVLKIWQRLSRAYLLPHFTTHQLRHTSASMLAAAGTDILIIAAHLGHQDLRSAQIYAKAAGSKLQAARSELDVAM